MRWPWPTEACYAMGEKWFRQIFTVYITHKCTEDKSEQAGSKIK
jgi:hypothetical protein